MSYSVPNAVAIGGVAPSDGHSPHYGVARAVCGLLQFLEKIFVCMNLELNLIKSAPGNVPWNKFTKSSLSAM